MNPGGAIGEHNLAALAETSFARHGDRESLFFEGVWHRSGDLQARSRRLAAGFIQLGVRPGDRVVVLMANSPSVGVLYSALWRAGAAITPAIFLLSEPEIRHILTESEAVAVVTSPEFLARVQAAAAGIPTLRWVICEGGEAGLSLADVEANTEADIVPRADSDMAALMFTGGTTGRAKGVVLSHHNLWHAGHASHEAGYVPGINRALVSLPLSHAFGLLVTVVGMHAAEPGASVLMRWFDPAALLSLAQEHRVQVIPVVPSMLQLLLSQDLESYDLSSLRYFSSGAAPLAADVIHEIERRIPGVEIREGYGLTESSGIISTTRPGRRRLGSVGLPVPGCEVRILDDDGREMPLGDAGEICARSPTVMQGYWRAPEATAVAMAGAWLRTGDIGHLDADGYLFISDRKKDLILRGGFNVFPRDVEDVLLQHPAISMAGVVGRPDPVMGEEVVAFVSLRAGAEVAAQALVEFSRERLGSHKYPREVNIIEQVPLTAVGKIDRKSLRARLTRGT